MHLYLDALNVMRLADCAELCQELQQMRRFESLPGTYALLLIRVGLGKNDEVAGAEGVVQTDVTGLSTIVSAYIGAGVLVQGRKLRANS